MNTKLVMPNSYVVMEQEEMEYVDGGGNIVNGLFNFMINVPSVPRVLAILGYTVTDTIMSSSITQSIVVGIKNFKSAVWGGFNGGFNAVSGTTQDHNSH